jgi:hypothetical protein
MVRTALAVLIPGYGLLAFRRLVSPVLLLAASAALLAVSVGLATPYSFETRFALPGQEVPPTLLAGAWILVYSISILGYLSLQLRADAKEAAQAAPVRSRIRLSSRDHSARAA